MDKKGAVGLATSKAFTLGIFTIAIIGFALVIALVQLNNANPAAAGSAAANQSASILNNVTGGVESFFGNATTWFALLAIVVLVLIIMIVLRSVNSGTGKGGL